MNRKKAALLLALLAGLAVCLAVFWQRFLQLSGSEEGVYEIYDRHYVMITGREDSDFWDRVYESALAEGKKRGVYVERFGEDLAVEYGRNELLKLAMQASVDGIIVPGDEEEETIALLQEVVEQGIPVVNVLQDSTGSIRQCFVGNNSYNLGQDYGRQSNISLIVASTRSVTRHLHQLARVAGEVSGGNFDIGQIPVQSMDEVGIATKAFNEMVENIRNYIK